MKEEKFAITFGVMFGLIVGFFIGSAWTMGGVMKIADSIRIEKVDVGIDEEKLVNLTYEKMKTSVPIAVPEEKVGLYCELDLDGNCKRVFIKNESNQFEKIAEDTDGNWS